jgi:hypothetical protein
MAATLPCCSARQQADNSGAQQATRPSSATDACSHSRVYVHCNKAYTCALSCVSACVPTQQCRVARQKETLANTLAIHMKPEKIYEYLQGFVRFCARPNVMCHSIWSDSDQIGKVHDVCQGVVTFTQRGAWVLLHTHCGFFIIFFSHSCM